MAKLNRAKLRAEVLDEALAVVKALTIRNNIGDPLWNFGIEISLALLKLKELK